MDFLDALIQARNSVAGVDPAAMSAAADTPVDWSAMGQAIPDGVASALTNPATYLDSAMMLPGSPKMGGPFGGVNSVRSSKPNWVWGEAGKGGKGWRWGADGKTLNSASQQVRAIPQQKGGLPATQGGLPATVEGARGGLPAVQGGLPALMSNKELATALRGQVPGAAAGGAGKTPFWATVLGGGGVLGMDAMLGPEDEQAPEATLIPSATESLPFQRGSQPWDALVAQANQIGGGDVRPFETLPTIDYGDRVRPDFEAARQVLQETAPEAPAERSIFQDLSKWAVPALAFGLLGGLPGAVLGGLMGQGRKETDDQARDAAFTRESNEHSQSIADFDLAAARENRGYDTADIKDARDATIQDFGFGRDQRTERRDEAAFVDNRSVQAMQKILMGLQAHSEGQGLDRNAFLLNQLQGSGGGGSLTAPMDAQDMLGSMIQADPNFASVVANHPVYQEAQIYPKGDPRHDAALVQVMMEMKNDPVYGPVLQQLEQQNASNQIMKLF
ncbi:hypothetical protein [Idiomarina abyssalis]|uniref:hypothetical protein n=1 Tax=Idiomarina abyssalis TaxID=86102 RepID=UPI003A8E334D